MTTTKRRRPRRRLQSHHLLSPSAHFLVAALVVVAAAAAAAAAVSMEQRVTAAADDHDRAEGVAVVSVAATVGANRAQVCLDEGPTTWFNYCTAITPARCARLQGVTG